MKKITCIIFVLNAVFALNAQIKLTGNITDEIGALSDVNISIKKTIKGVVSDKSGHYEIEAKKGDTLMFSYLGYITKEIVVNNDKVINLKLEGNIALDEVMVVGYGTVSCRSISCTGCMTNCKRDMRYQTFKKFKSDIIKEKLYPNPSKSGQFKLNILKPYTNVQIQVSTISGQHIKSFNYKNINNKINIDLSQYPSGLYIINIIADRKPLESKKAIIG
ncbi:carboxypeptidase-like regulatory domain-containing protein [uncultured Algibacter sp.]|uniref:carboxypeptidase-like regulatory domain-containing protein n=1 Tax=uncultured Algibacter sp. TaxID=298659 RepID=UPI003216ED32